MSSVIPRTSRPVDRWRFGLTDREAHVLAGLAAFLLGLGIYVLLVPSVAIVAAAAIYANRRNFRWDPWQVGFLALTLVFYIWYRVAFVLPPMHEGAEAVSVRLYATVVLHVVLGFLLVASAASRRDQVHIVVLISLGMLAKASMILVATALVASPPFYATGGFDPILSFYINPNNINDIAVYSATTLVVFVVFAQSDFSAAQRIAGILLLAWSLVVGVAFGGRTWLVLLVVAFVAMSLRSLTSKRNWRFAGIILGTVALINLLAASLLDFYRAGAETLIERLLSNGFTTTRFGLFADWFRQFIDNPFVRPVVDHERFGVWWFHDLWMDAHRTSGLAAMALAAVLWLMPGVKLVGPVVRGDNDAWQAFVAYACILLLAAVSVPIEGSNFAGLIYFGALAALILRPTVPASRLPVEPANRAEPVGTRIRSFAGEAGVRRYFFNTSWMMSEQVLRLLAGLAIGVYVARFLGPSQYGTYAYVIAFVGIFATFAKLGLDTVVVRDLVDHPERRQEIVGTAFWLKLGGGCAALAMIVAVLPWAGNDATTNFYVVIIGAGILLQAFDVVDAYFQSITQAKYSAICKTVQLAISSIVKLGLIVAGADLVWFVVVVLIDQATLAVAYLFLSWRKNLIADLASFAPATATRLLSDCWPLIISGVAIILYMRIDQVMIKSMLGEHDVGIYAAAVRIAEVIYFVPMIVSASLFPRLVAARRAGEEAFREATLQLFELMSVLAWLAAVSFFFLSGTIVWFLFGHEYEAAGAVLAVSSWAAVFVFSGVVGQQWAIARNLTRQAMIKAIVGAALNILLNLLLIPAYGVIGAAMATLVSQAVASVGLNFVFPSTRECFYLQVRAILLPGSRVVAFLRTQPGAAHG